MGSLESPHETISNPRSQPRTDLKTHPIKNPYCNHLNPNVITVRAFLKTFELTNYFLRVLTSELPELLILNRFRKQT